MMPSRLVSQLAAGASGPYPIYNRSTTANPALYSNRTVASCALSTEGHPQAIVDRAPQGTYVRY